MGIFPVSNDRREKTGKVSSQVTDVYISKEIIRSDFFEKKFFKCI